MRGSTSEAMPTPSSRTAMTATTTFLSLLALVLFGGTAIEGFALVMLFGVVVCTYSAMFISTPVLLYMDVRSAGAREEAQEAAQHEASMAQRQREERETTARLAELHMKITERTKVLREVNRAVAEIKKHLRGARPE